MQNREMAASGVVMVFKEASAFHHISCCSCCGIFGARAMDGDTFFNTRKRYSIRYSGIDVVSTAYQLYCCVVRYTSSRHYSRSIRLFGTRICCCIPPRITTTTLEKVLRDEYIDIRSLNGLKCIIITLSSVRHNCVSCMQGRSPREAGLRVVSFLLICSGRRYIEETVICVRFGTHVETYSAAHNSSFNRNMRLFINRLLFGTIYTVPSDETYKCSRNIKIPQK